MLSLIQRRLNMRHSLTLLLMDYKTQMTTRASCNSTARGVGSAEWGGETTIFTVSLSCLLDYFEKAVSCSFRTFPAPIQSYVTLLVFCSVSVMLISCDSLQLAGNTCNCCYAIQLQDTHVCIENSVSAASLICVRLV